MSSSKSQKRPRPMRDESAGSEDDELMEVVEKKQPKKKPSAAPSEAKKKSSKPKVDSSSSEEESDTAASKKRKRELIGNGSSKKGKEATVAATNGKAKQKLRPSNGKDDVSSADSSEELKPAPKRTKHSKQDSEEEEEEEAPRPKKKQPTAAPELKKSKEADSSPKSDKPKKKNNKASAESGSEGSDEDSDVAYPASSFSPLVKMKKDKTPHLAPEKVAAFVGTEACLVALEPAIRAFLETAFSSGDKYRPDKEVDIEASIHHGEFFDALRTALFDEGSERRKYSHKLVMDGLAPLTGVFHTKSDVAGYTAAEKEYLQASARYFANHQGFAICPTSKGNRLVGAKHLFTGAFGKTPVEIADDNDISLKKIKFDEFIMTAVGSASHYQVLKQTELMEEVARVKTLPSLTFGMLAEILEHLRKTKSFVGCESGVLMVKHILTAFAKKSQGKRAALKNSGGGKQSSSKGRANSTEDEEDDEVRDVDEVIEAKRRERAKSKAAAVSVPEDELAADEHAEDAASAAAAAANASRRFSDQE